MLIVATDHHPLLKIFGDRPLEDTSNPRILNFNEKALPYTFEMIHEPGKNMMAKTACPDTQAMPFRQNQMTLFCQ